MNDSKVYDLNNKSIMVTGGTGSFGKAFVQKTLENFSNVKIIIYSRDEMKQWDMAIKYQNNHRIKFVIGDIRDKDSLFRALDGVDLVVHAAATKIVPIAEYNPFECVKTNIEGAMNLINACIDKKIDRVVALSTDKASNPINLYGATKLAADKLFLAANSNDGSHKTKFSVVRYGNVMNSRGSVIPYFLSLKSTGILPITDERMTRFMINLDQAIELVWKSIFEMFGGEIFIKKIPSMNIIEIAKAIDPLAKIKIVGIRPGEKIHEQMIGVEDAPYTIEYDDYFKILPALHDWSKDKKRIGSGKKVPDGFVYESLSNENYMTSEFLKKWIDKNIKD
ncbi:UDP-N-acetylglucosamine 4,6-dehydratase (inverting) [Pseudomonadota bacterium]|nr:UDP-N-acetylglucosamine 4,6-dehydratase (inverting) [Pseudomonadota bacterium]